MDPLYPFDAAEGGLFRCLSNDLEDVLGEDLVQLLQSDCLMMEPDFPCADSNASSLSYGSKGGYASSSPIHECLADADSTPALLVRPDPAPKAARVITTFSQPANPFNDKLFLDYVHNLATVSPSTTSHDSRGNWANKSSGTSTSGKQQELQLADEDEGEDLSDQSDRKVNKRKAPEVDWKAIEDPAERRRQRRLAKNRVTAARSRERKKVQFGELELRLQALESENRQLKDLLQQCMKENNLLRNQLGNGSKYPCGGGRGCRVEPAVLILIATLLITCCVLPANQMALLGSCLPVVLIAQISSQLSAPVSEVMSEVMLFLQTLLSKAKPALRKCLYKALCFHQSSSPHENVRGMLLSPTVNHSILQLRHAVMS